MKLSIQRENKKLGRVPNVSLPPRKTCNRKAGCTKAGGCYYWKFYRYSRHVRQCVEGNLRLWQKHPDQYEQKLVEFLEKRELLFFRWHVGGDIPDKKYWEMMKRLARQFPETHFLAFTKQYDFIHGRIPKNLTIVLSGWPDLEIPRRLRRRFQVAWVRFKDCPDKRIPDNAIECYGNCETCGMCWDLPSIGRDVVFDKH